MSGRARPRRQRRVGQDGSVVMALAFSMALIMGMTIAAMVIGRQAYSRRELQSAVDGLAVMGAHSLEQRGMPYQSNRALYYIPKNSSLKIISSSVKPLGIRSNEKRRIIQANITGQMRTWQDWFKNAKFLNISVESHAQVNEQTFGDRWPVLIFVLDASLSMERPILGSGTTAAWKVLSDLVFKYASNTFPVRNGVVTFNSKWQTRVKPSTASVNNNISLKAALGLKREKGTNFWDALNQTRSMLASFKSDGKNVILVGDGEPTLGASGCNYEGTCAWTQARSAASAVRNSAGGNGAALFSVEIRRTNYTKLASKLFTDMAGQPKTGGKNAGMHYIAQSAVGIQAFLNALTRSLCAFKLSPRPGLGPDKYCRPRRSDPTPGTNPQRVFAFLQLSLGVEQTIPIVKNRDASPLSKGFEYYTDSTGAYVILSIKSCNDLGANASRRLVVRWDDPVVISKPDPERKSCN